MDRNTLRSVAFKNPPAKRISFQYNGNEFELVSPTVKERKNIMSKAKTDSPSILDIQEWIAIFCTVVPGTNERVFEETDYDTFENMQMQGFLDIVGEHAEELLNVNSDPKK